MIKIVLILGGIDAGRYCVYYEEAVEPDRHRQPAVRAAWAKL